MTSDSEATRCATHPDVETYLRCGKCGKPICPRCMVETPVGARCRDCANVQKSPTYSVESTYYLRAIGTALGMAIVIGVVWGIIESILPYRFFTLLIGMGIGYAIGEVVSLAVNRKRGTPLAVIGSLGVVLCFVITTMTDYFISGFLILDAMRIVFTLLAIAFGGYIAFNRLR